MRAASSEVVRDINRRIVLNLVRTRQPISRADLARVSGLQRSTISLIVEQLMQENWVLEGPTGRLPRGRRPTYLHLNDERVIVGVDVRPSQITVALADANGRFASQEVMDTPADAQTAIDWMVASVRRIIGSCGRKKVEGVGISVPGRFDTATERLVFAPNLKWRDVDIRGPIARATGLDVAVENAANACVLAAVWFDRPEDVTDMVVVTVSEGIGAGILANGQLVHGFGGMAGEFGHVPVDPSGPPCGCGSRGCWEVFASNRAAVRYYREATGGKDRVTFGELLGRADHGDEAAAGALDQMAHHLGRGMRMIVAGVAPQRIVVIGDLTRSWRRFGPVIEAEVQAQVLPGGGVPAVIPTHEDGMARLRGTIALVLQKHFSVT